MRNRFHALEQTFKLFGVEPIRIPIREDMAKMITEHQRIRAVSASMRIEGMSKFKLRK